MNKTFVKTVRLECIGVVYQMENGAEFMEVTLPDVPGVIGTVRTNGIPMPTPPAQDRNTRRKDDGAVLMKASKAEPKAEEAVETGKG